MYGGSGVYGAGGAYGVGSHGHYYQPAATSSIHQSRVFVPASSTVHQSHLVVPATNRVFQYQPYTAGQSSYSADAYGNYGNGGQQFSNSQGNSGYDSNAVNGGQVKTRRYQIRRPAIKKEFYDIEEKVIIRPAGSALIELDSPISKQLKQDSYAPGYGQREYSAGQAYNPNQENQYNQGFEQRVYSPRPVYNPSYNPYPYPNQFNGNPRGINCDRGHGHGQSGQIPTTTYLTPTTTIGYQPTTTYSTPGQNFPTTTYAPTPNVYTSSSPQPPSRTYVPPYNDQNTNQYHPTTFAPTSESSTPRQTVTSSSTNQDVFVSSTTPVSVTIVDTADSGSTNNSTQRNLDDIIYARGQSNYGNNQYSESDENGPDGFRNELPPRGDVGQTADYRQPDQFFHELPRSRYTGPYQPPAVHVETKYNGEPTEKNYYAEEIPIGNRSQNSSRNSTDQSQRLIDLYTGSNGGITEIGVTNEQQQANSARYTNDGGSSYNDVGNVKARVISATPAPEGAQPSEHVNTRRIVVSKRVETVQEIEVPENNGTATTQNGNSNGQSANYNANYDNANNSPSQYNDDNKYYSSQYNDGRSSSSNYENGGDYNSNSNQANYASGGASESSSRYSAQSAPSGYYISTTPSSAGKRVIYVKPVTQEFAQQKAVAPQQSSNQRRI